MAMGEKRIGYHWHLRLRMAEHGMFSTTDLIPHLTDRGVQLSSVQVYRLVAQKPERLNMHVLACLCDILGCSPSDLVEPFVESQRRRQVASANTVTAGEPPRKRHQPTRAQIVPSN